MNRLIRSMLIGATILSSLTLIDIPAVSGQARGANPEEAQRAAY